MFYCILKKEFSKIWSFRSDNFFEKFLQISQKNHYFFWFFSESNKIIIFTSKLLQNHNIDPNFPLKLQKSTNFSLDTHEFFKTFGAFGPENLEFKVPSDPIFLELGSPLLVEVPPPKKTTSDCNIFE